MTIIIVVAILLASSVISWRSRWNSHADHINAQAVKKREGRKSHSTSRAKSRCCYRRWQGHLQNHTRDVVKYVQSPNRTVCRFDDDAVQLRQRAIDVANTIPGFDESAVQGK